MCPGGLLRSSNTASSLRQHVVAQRPSQPRDYLVTKPRGKVRRRRTAFEIPPQRRLRFTTANCRREVRLRMRRPTVGGSAKTCTTLNESSQGRIPVRSSSILTFTIQQMSPGRAHSLRHAFRGSQAASPFSSAPKSAAYPMRTSATATGSCAFPPAKSIAP